jgi:hypothetical protein
MFENRYCAYRTFVRDRRPDLQRIVNAAKDCELADVESQAWVMACDVFEARGEKIDFDDAGFQDRLIAYLFQFFVRYVDKRFRHSVRFNQESNGDQGTHVRSLLERITDDNALDPLANILASESFVSEPDEPGCHHSQASAWLHLLRRHGDRMDTLARHLLISTSWCYRCHAKAVLLTRQQRVLPDTLSADGIRLSLQPWRRCRAERVPLQLSFAFEQDVMTWADPAAAAAAAA